MGLKISYLGMGIMGSAMAFNLLKHGHPVKVWNRNQNRPVLAELAAAGAVVETSLADCVRDATIIFTCLGDENDVYNRLVGDSESVMHLLASGKSGTSPLIVDFSTIGPQMAIQIANELAAAGIRFLDAPVTGGDVGARNGTMTIMVGGAEPDFDQVLPWLECLGKNIKYCGKAGAGQALKLCNQVLCAVNMVAVSEALTLAADLDIAPELVVDVLQTGAGGSWALANLGKRILQEDLKPAFSIRNMLKDLRLVFASLENEGQSGGAAVRIDPDKHLPGTALATQLFKTVGQSAPEAMDDCGTQAMIRAYQAKTGP